jgi:hypothetical protein
MSCGSRSKSSAPSSTGSRPPSRCTACAPGTDTRRISEHCSPGLVLFDGPRPAELHPFVELHGEHHRAVSTPGDLLFHIRAERADLCFELATLIVDHFGTSVEIVDDVHGFRYFDDRDLLGFVDDPPGAPSPVPPTTAPTDPTPPSEDGSLRIGSLRPPCAAQEEP